MRTHLSFITESRGTPGKLRKNTESRPLSQMTMENVEKYRENNVHDLRGRKEVAELIV